MTMSDQYVISGDDSGYVNIFDIKSGICDDAKSFRELSSITTVNMRGKVVIVGTLKNYVKIYNIKTNK